MSVAHSALKARKPSVPQRGHVEHAPTIKTTEDAGNESLFARAQARERVEARVFALRASASSERFAFLPLPNETVFRGMTTAHDAEDREQAARQANAAFCLGFCALKAASVARVVL